MADSVNERFVSLRDALSWHLQSNHYPPLPAALIDTAEQAIALANDEADYDEPVSLPEGITWRNQTSAPLGECIEAWHLDSFIEREEW